MNARRRKVIERVIREHYQPEKINAVLTRQMTSHWGPRSFRWLSDAGVEELAKTLGREHRYRARAARDCRQFNATLRVKETADV